MVIEKFGVFLLLVLFFFRNRAAAEVAQSIQQQNIIPDDKCSSFHEKIYLSTVEHVLKHPYQIMAEVTSGSPVACSGTASGAPEEISVESELEVVVYGNSVEVEGSDDMGRSLVKGLNMTHTDFRRVHRTVTPCDISQLLSKITQKKGSNSETNNASKRHVYLIVKYYWRHGDEGVSVTAKQHGEFRLVPRTTSVSSIPLKSILRITAPKGQRCSYTLKGENATMVEVQHESVGSEGSPRTCKPITPSASTDPTIRKGSAFIFIPDATLFDQCKIGCGAEVDISCEDIPGSPSTGETEIQMDGSDDQNDREKETGSESTGATPPGNQSQSTTGRDSTQSDSSTVSACGSFFKSFFYFLMAVAYLV